MKTLRRHMKRKRLSQVELARLVGVTQPTVWAWLAGRKNPTLEHLGKLADLTGLTVDALMDRKAA